MNIDELIALGNQARADRDPNKALEYYTYAMAVDRNSPAAFNNYGNVLQIKNWLNLNTKHPHN